MPCPPSYEEQIAQTGNHWARVAQDSARSLKGVQNLISLLLKEGVPSNPATTDILAKSTELTCGREPDWWHDPAQSPALQRWVGAAKQDGQRLERDMCEALTALVCLWDATPGALKTEARTERYLALEHVHRKHREEDRRRVLQNIKNKRGHFSKDSTEFLHFDILHRKVAALDIEDLLRDRAMLPDVL